MTVVSGTGTEFVTTEDGEIFVSLDAVIKVGQNSYDLACERSVEEARLAASFTELFRKFKRDCEAQIVAEKILELQGTDYHATCTNHGDGSRPIREEPSSQPHWRGPIPLLGEADPELERLLAEEEEIDRRVHGKD